MKEIKHMSLEEYLKNPKFGIYIYIYDYISFDKEWKLIQGFKNINIFCDGRVIRKLFKNNNISEGKIRYLAKRHTRYLSGITSLLKVDLLDKNNNVIDSVKVGESEMPLEFRGKI